MKRVCKHPDSYKPIRPWDFDKCNKADSLIKETDKLLSKKSAEAYEQWDKLFDKR